MGGPRLLEDRGTCCFTVLVLATNDADDGGAMGAPPDTSKLMAQLPARVVEVPAKVARPIIWTGGSRQNMSGWRLGCLGSRQPFFQGAYLLSQTFSTASAVSGTLLPANGFLKHPSIAPCSEGDRSVSADYELTQIVQLSDLG